MKTFIKVIEIWIPDKNRTQLIFGAGLYGDLTDFKAASEQQQFAYNEGLPGKAWARGHPIILKKFDHSYFKRTEAAHRAGLTCGIALPIFAGDFLIAVVVFLCGDDQEVVGAIEVWGKDTDDALTLLDGYYGTLQRSDEFGCTSRLDKGQGLPGIAWQVGIPVLSDDQHSALYQNIRGLDAEQPAITAALGIPLIYSDNQIYIMTFLSAKATPIAKRIQIWIPDRQGEHLICQQGYSKHSNNLAKIFETLAVKKGVGALGRVWLTGMPTITGNQEAIGYNTELDSLNSMLAIPVIRQGCLKAIVAFLF